VLNPDWRCALAVWLLQVVHYTADAPHGPWLRRDVVLPVWSHCPSTALSPNGTVVLWSFKASNKKPKSGADAWGNHCQGGASPCGFAKHGCGPDAPPPPPSPHPPPSGNCATWANVSARYACSGASCLSDGPRVSGHCGVGLCPDNSTLPLCQPLNCTSNYSTCPTMAATRCDAEPTCHGFALFDVPWRENRAQFFASGASGLTPQGQWTAYTKSKSNERARGKIGRPTWSP
jgi:hypothetical protein